MPQATPRDRLEAKTRTILSLINDMIEIAKQHHIDDDDLNQIEKAIKQRYQVFRHQAHIGPEVFKL